MKEKVKKVLQFLLNPRFLLCFGIAWMITNGWSYILLGFGMFLKIEWMVWVSTTYLAFLWLPFTPEKIVTLFITVFLLKWLFPGDQKTLAVILREQEVLRAAMARAKQKRRHKRMVRWLLKELPKRRALRNTK